MPRANLRHPWLAFRSVAGRNLSIRWKLTLWYGAMCALTLAVVGAGMRSALSYRIQSSIKGQLESTAAAMTASLTAADVRRFPAPSPCTPVSETQALRLFYLDLQNNLDDFAVRNSKPGQFEEVDIATPGYANLKTVVSSTAPQAQFKGITMDPEATLFVTLYGRSVHKNYAWNGTLYDAYFVPLALPPGLSTCGAVGVLEIILPANAYLPIEQAVDGIIVLGIPIGVLVALAAGWWIARAALRPINRISRTVEAIGGSRDLTRRVNFVGPPDEVGRLARTFDLMMQRLQRSFDAQRRFIADASHELRTPLTAIRGNAELMTIAPPEERNICLISIRREAERMSRLVNDLLLLAEAEAEQQPLQKSLVDLRDVVEEGYRAAVVLADGKVSVRVDGDRHLHALADLDRLRQLLLNLVDNAVKFTQEGGAVTISLIEEEDAACIYVSDTGPGIPADQQDAIFERFFRVDESRSARGSGLGLAISRWIVEAHGGSLSVRSELGRGSTFSVRIPLPKGSAGSRPVVVKA
ncbi:MAG: sensor histidine kinase [Chloroflexota bacterium]